MEYSSLVFCGNSGQKGTNKKITEDSAVKNNPFTKPGKSPIALLSKLWWILLEMILNRPKIAAPIISRTIIKLIKNDNGKSQRSSIL